MGGGVNLLPEQDLSSHIAMEEVTEFDSCVICGYHAYQDHNHYNKLLCFIT